MKSIFDPDEESEILRHLIRDYTSEAGVRDLERIIRTLFLRIQRKEIMAEGKNSAKINFVKVLNIWMMPNRQRFINEDDRIGEAMGLGVNMEMGVGSLDPDSGYPGADRPRQERWGLCPLEHGPHHRKHRARDG